MGSAHASLVPLVLGIAEIEVARGELAEARRTIARAQQLIADDPEAAADSDDAKRLAAVREQLAERAPEKLPGRG
jgi:hypothetical protein